MVWGPKFKSEKKKNKKKRKNEKKDEEERSKIKHISNVYSI
jgi:hypothetical protein